ncbi:MAG: GNAT family N-acetyltransferase [Verrucomicrobia bacterium]|nr:GNAT family N-acetyltransferase [Verrucomicrobiota bacterium]
MEPLKQFVLERATVADVDTLVAFERKVADPRIYGPTLDAQGALQEISKNTFYFIKTGALVVGTAAYCLRPDKSVYISNVAVDPTYRRQGIARAAMSFILEKCKGAHRIDLVTHPENKNALQLYASLGFKVESRRENFFGDGEPRLVLALKGDI